MTKVIDFHEADTAISGATGSVALDVLNYAKDWVPTQTVAGQTMLSYSKAPPDAKSTLRYATTPVSNIYTGSTVDASYQLPNKRGISLLTQLTQVVTVVDDADPLGARIDLPFSTHVVFRCPLTSLLTDAQYTSLFVRGISGIADSSLSNTALVGARLAQLIRGQMTPSGV